MTMVMGFKVKGVPFLISDLLTTVPDSETGRWPSTPRRKLLEITDTFVVGWAGSELWAGIVISAIVDAKERLKSFDDLRTLLKDPPITDMPPETSLKLIGWFGPDVCFTWDVHDPETFWVEAPQAIGSARKEGEHWAQVSMAIGAESDDMDPIKAALEGPCRLMGRELIDQMNQRVLGWGFCYDVVYWHDGAFVPLTNVLYEVTTCHLDEHGVAQEPQLNFPSYRAHAIRGNVVVARGAPPSRVYRPVAPIVDILPFEGLPEEDASFKDSILLPAIASHEGQSAPSYRCIIVRLLGPFGPEYVSLIVAPGDELGTAGSYWLLPGVEERFSLDKAFATKTYASLISDRESWLLASADAGNLDDLVRFGQLREWRGDREGAESAYRRADESGSGIGATALGWFLERHGQPAAAEAAYWRADERAHGGGASQIGLLRRRQGDLKGAIEAFRRADELGDTLGSNNLGVALTEAGDHAAAIEAYRRAESRGDPIAAQNLALALEREGKDRAAALARQRSAVGRDELPRGTRPTYGPSHLPRPEAVPDVGFLIDRAPTGDEFRRSRGS